MEPSGGKCWLAVCCFPLSGSGNGFSYRAGWLAGGSPLLTTCQETRHIASWCLPPGDKLSPRNCLHPD